MALALAALGLAASVATAGAVTLPLGLDVEFSGATEPEGPKPWITATFDDSFGGANTVRLIMSADNLLGGQNGENITGWYFNFDPSLDPTDLSFAVVDNSDSVPGISTGANAFQADGDGKFDILFAFPPPPGNKAKRFTGGETVIYDITYISPIDVSSFDFSSEQGGGQGSFLSAAHVQRIGENRNGGWIGVVPEPATALLLGFGLLGLAAAGRRF